MSDFRLGDVIDDYCIKCKRLTNHSIVSLVDGAAAKVRCRTCYNDHDYRHEQIPPSKKDLKKAELFKEVLSTVAPAPEGEAEADSTPAVVPDVVPDQDTAAEPEPAAAPAAKKTRGRAKRA